MMTDAPHDTPGAAPSAAAASPGDAGAIARPSLLRYAPALILLVITVADAGRYADTDLWGHIYFGNAAMHASHFIDHDPYNYSVPGHYWMAHEWLSEAIMARVYDAGGVIGLKLWRYSVTAAAIVGLSFAVAESGAAVPIQFVVLIASAFALIPVMQFRPQIFSYALFAILIAMLARDNYRGRAPLWVAIPMLALWSNLHGGFFIGLVTLGIYAATNVAVDLAGGRGLGRGLRLGAIAAASAIATLVNPRAFGTWQAVIDSLRNPMTRSVVADWRPLMAVVAGAHGLHSGIIFLVAVLVLIAAFALSVMLAPRGGDFALVAIGAVMSAAAFTAVRNIPLAVIATATPLAHHLSLAIGKWRGGRELTAAQAHAAADARMTGLGQSVIGLTVVILLLGKGGLFAPTLPAATDYPVGAVGFMRAHQLHGNILNDFDWGQYLIWHLAPESKVFIDGRFDLVYTPAVVRDYLAFFFGKPNGARILDAYPNDFILVPPKSAAYQTMIARAGWKLIYRDANAALFAPAKSAAAAIAGIPVMGIAPKSNFP
ncbi:MAG: hypothetical protein IVW54_17405 [Candidatus Binataceae bacterium]|nr:hypothetical protein [Candidatus Binataceae bacterium]